MSLIVNTAINNLIRTTFKLKMLHSIHAAPTVFRHWIINRSGDGLTATQRITWARDWQRLNRKVFSLNYVETRLDVAFLFGLASGFPPTPWSLSGGGVPQVFHSNLANFLDGACSALSIHPSDYLPNFYLDDKDQAFGDIFGGPCCVNLDRSS